MTQPPPPGHGPGPEPGLAQHGPADTCTPGPDLAALVADLSGPQWRCDGATDDELIGLLNRCGLRSSRGPPPGNSASPASCSAAALAISLPGADKLANLAWTLQARLPGIGAKLADGTIDYVKAAIIVKELFALDDAQAAEAEALILDQLAGKPPGQIGKMAAAAVVGHPQRTYLHPRT